MHEISNFGGFFCNFRDHILSILRLINITAYTVFRPLPKKWQDILADGIEGLHKS